MMFIVFVIQHKSKRIAEIGVSEDFSATFAYFSIKHKVKDTDWRVLLQEKYKSKKDALIRVKQLKNKGNR